MRTSPTGKCRNSSHGLTWLIDTPAQATAKCKSKCNSYKDLHINDSGFTFVELMVVVGIFTIVLLFSIPVFRQIHLTSNASDHAAGLIFFLENLKHRAMVENKNFTLHMDSGSGKIYVTDDTMDEDARQVALNNGVSLKGDLQLLNLEFPDDDTRPGDDKTICFFSKGYSDRALIHVREDSREMTIQLCMFQKKVHLIDQYVSYDDCI
ncbi:prepilin-type N-terminal cleavage/methylation domain-containing protein [uncultured Desulfobacter sp.]|uniref:pilus assembly FimT family protein n=1 Tax=uncultured Desulfobacter sp. TaxID=240139 RepID=UPI0029C65A70|nr:prepilin-type N-terminal cleavage/methylation domain-containing protein [uncultured Desulfobacter sp.]